MADTVTASKKLLLLPGLLLGVLALALALKLKPSPELLQHYDPARLVELQTLAKQQVAPEVLGFGRVEPKHVWQAVAEVSGRLVYRHPQLETGRLLPKATVLLEIDPLEYQLKLAQAQANLNATQTRLNRIDKEAKNLNTSLKTEQQKLALVKQEYERKLVLKEKNLISQSDIEAQQQALLTQRKLVHDLESAFELLPDDTKVALAQLSVDQAQLDDAQRQLDKTRLSLPFDARIAAVNIEQDQVVTLGSLMLEAYQLGTVEIKAELSLKDIYTLRRSIQASPQAAPLKSIEDLELAARVVFQTADIAYEWPAKVTRVAETVNPEQATVGIYLEVEQAFPELQLIERDKPPLTKGMFVSAYIQGFASPQFLVPDKALHGDRIYLMNAEQQLEIVEVQVLFRTADKVAIAGDIEEGAQLVLNDLIPAIAGMSLKPMNASDAPAAPVEQ
jgi:multidrug efflux pump subunit AcrA (membrane-fusion protein)